MKILVFSHNYPSLAEPVAGLFVRSATEALHDLGKDVRVVAPVPFSPPPLRWLRPKWRQYAQTPYRSSENGIEVIRPRYLSPPREMWLNTMHQRVRRAAQGELSAYHRAGGRLIHAHGCIPNARAVMAERARGAKVVVTIHGRDVFALAPRSVVLRTQVAETLQNVDHVVYVSDRVRRLGFEIAGEHPSSVIFSGVDIDEGIQRQEPDAFTVICMAVMIPRKQIDAVIKGFALFSKTHTGARLKIVGDGPLREELETLAQAEGVTDRTEFTGNLEHQVAMAEIAKSSVLVMPSYDEAMGCVYLEAMSLGVPVVGALDEGISEIVTDGKDGFLVAAGDHVAVANKLQALAEQSDLPQKISAAGQATIQRLQLTSWRHQAAQHIELYQTLLAQT